MKFYDKISVALLVVMICALAGKLYAQETDISALAEQAQKAGIEQSLISELQNRAETRGISNQELETIFSSAIAMAEENLPAEAAIQKALEGLSKGIPGNRIISVVDQVHKSLGEAVKIVDPWMKRPEVQGMIEKGGRELSQNQFRSELAKAASKSIMQNISSQEVNEVMSQIGTEEVLANSGPSDIIAAMGILPDLPTGGSQESGTFVVRALKGGFNASELQKLPSAIKMAQQRSELPAASVIEGVSKQMSGGIPAKQILQNLFNGNVGGGPPGNIPKGLKNKQNRGNSNGG